jgi:hypothetical protein
VEFGEDQSHLVAGQDDRQPLRPGRTDDAELVERSGENRVGEEQQRGEGLVLRGGGDIAIDG